MDLDKYYTEIFDRKIRKMLEKKYIRKWTRSEADQICGKTWYLPHFGVVNPNKPIKLRIVLDSSGKSNSIYVNN